MTAEDQVIESDRFDMFSDRLQNFINFFRYFIKIDLIFPRPRYFLPYGRVVRELLARNLSATHALNTTWGGGQEI
jgi:hypothetical protein